MFKYKGGTLPIGGVIHPRVWKNNKNLAMYGQFTTFNKNTTFIAMQMQHVCVAINRHVIIKINNWLCVMFWNHNSYAMATVRAMWQLHNEICNVLHHNNFITKNNVNLIDKNH